MRTPMAAILLAGTAVLALTASAASLSAATATTTTWTVTPGGVTTGTANPVTLSDGTTGGSISCPDDMDWYLHHHGPNPYGSVTGLFLGTCTGPLGQTLTLTARALPWELNGTSYNPATGVMTGTITGIDATLSGASCSAVIDGTGPGADNGQVTNTYTNGTAKTSILTSGSSLHIYDVSGCAGLFRDGDAATISATYTMTPPQTITSP